MFLAQSGRSPDFPTEYPTESQLPGQAVAALPRTFPTVAGAFRIQGRRGGGSSSGYAGDVSLFQALLFALSHARGACFFEERTIVSSLAAYCMCDSGRPPITDRYLKIKIAKISTKTSNLSVPLRRNPWKIARPPCSLNPPRIGHVLQVSSE